MKMILLQRCEDAKNLKNSISKTLRLCVFAVICSLPVFSQTVEVQKSTRIEKIDGKQFYIHTIIKGQTLYSLSKAYNVLISEIIFENPEVIDGIKQGMELKIPAVSTTGNVSDSYKNKPVEINGKNRIHRVEKGETLYSLSRQYLIPVEEIKKANPGISDTLKLGQNLNIPVEQLVKSGETVYTTIVTESLKANESIDIGINKINVVLLLPLYLDENKSARNDTSGSSSHESIYAKSLNGLEFYEGALLAADSLSRAGVNASIYTFDIPDDLSLAKILSNPVLKKADIIIGPFFGKRFEAVAAFAKENKIACVTPILWKNDVAESNPYVSKVLPSDETQIKQMGDFIGRWNCKKNILILHSANATDSLLLEILITGIKSRCDSAKVHILNTKGRSVKLVDSLMQPAMENIIVSFLTNESYISRLVLYLEKKNAKQRVVTLFGLNEWQDFENIEVEYFQNVNLHLPVDLFVDYERTEVKKFLQIFREKYLTEPDKYGFLGYDVTLYYLQMLKKYGNKFYSNPAAIHAVGLQSNFDFKKLSEQGGLENQHTFILNYNDYRLVKVN